MSNPSDGTASLFGIDVRQPIARQRIGYLPELTYYYKFLTARELLRFYAKIFGIPPRPRRTNESPTCLKLVELEHAAGRPIKSLLQRHATTGAAWPRHWINNPDLLILDEPHQRPQTRCGPHESP